MMKHTGMMIIIAALFAGAVSGCGGGAERVHVTLPGSENGAQIVAQVSQTSGYPGDIFTLTCVLSGVSGGTIEGRCLADSAWTAITSGVTMSCSYETSGSYIPGCRLNGAVVDEVDEPVTISIPSIECYSDAQCVDGLPLTGDVCMNPGTPQSDCVNAPLSCVSAAGCDDADPVTQTDCVNNVCVVANLIPAADAGTDFTAVVFDEVLLNGSDSSDGDGDALTYLWVQTAGQSVALSDASAQSPSFIPTATGSYVFSLVVSDGKSSSAADTVTVYVSDRSGSVAGTVISGGAPVSGVVVRIYNDSYTAAAVTGADGFYYFTDVPSGDYYLVFAKDGYEIETIAVRVE